ncbi:Acyltransferase LovD [Apiospora arundinis]
MAQRIDKMYEEAVESSLLPGISVMAGDKNGNIVYSKSIGTASLKEGRDLPFTASTVCAFASMSKLMTSVAVLQCVEEGKLDLDMDVKPLLPSIGKYGIMKSFDEEKNSAVLEESTATITLRMLLSHTSGHEYDWFGPEVGKWRASRGEEPWTGLTVEDKSVLPLVFTPGTSWAYGAGIDWAGKLVEIATGDTLDAFTRARIWKPLGIEDDLSFYPKSRPSGRHQHPQRKGEPPAVDAASFDILFGGTECFGGVGLFGSTAAYHFFVSALLRRDQRLLKPDSYVELFRPQLNEHLEEEFNKYVAKSPVHTALLGMGIPLSIRKTWSFAGMVAKEAQPGRFAAGTTLWGGVPCAEWFIDHESGLCATVLCQIFPPMHPPVMALHARFQSELFRMIHNE